VEEIKCLLDTVWWSRADCWMKRKPRRGWIQLKPSQVQIWNWDWVWRLYLTTFLLLIQFFYYLKLILQFMEVNSEVTVRVDTITMAYHTTQCCSIL